MNIEDLMNNTEADVVSWPAEGKPKRLQIEIEIFSTYDVPEGPIAIVMAGINAKLESIPAEYRNQAVFVWVSHYDDSGSWKVTYERMQTPEEAAAELAEKAKYEAREKERRRQVYLRLSEEFKK